MSKLLEIFKPGKHTAMSGQEISFSEADLQASALAYDPTLHEAPLVIGHPKTDDPAFGWVKKLLFAENILQVEPCQVEPKFAEMVNDGRFKKISASFYTPDSPNNPKKGVFYLRHVGFLGAQPPALQGLKTASFNETDKGVITIEFGEWANRQNASLWRNFRNWLLSKFGMETADQVTPEFMVKDMEREAEKPVEVAQEPLVAGFSENNKEKNMSVTPEEIAKKEADLAQGQADLDRQKADFAEQQKTLNQKTAQMATEEGKRKRIAIVEFAEGLIKAGRVLPAFKDGLVSFMCQIGDQAVLEFGEAEKKVTENALDWMKGFLSKLPEQVPFGEFAPDSDAVVGSGDPAVIAQKAVAYQEAQARDGNVISVTQAVAHVTKGGK